MSDESFSDQIEVNRANWDARAEIHARSSFYDLEQYIQNPSAISSVVEWDRRLIGDVKGLDLLHLQCHIGTDTLSWARLGAHVVGLDLSPKSLRIARELAKKTGSEIEFVCGDVRQADRLVRRQFDIVYTSVGVLCWNPDIRQWATAVAACVRPGGRFYIRDHHPILSTFEYGRDDSQIVCIHNYFTDQPNRYETDVTYTGDETPVASPINYQWTHSMGDIITALAENGLRIEKVEELDWLDWQPFPWMIEKEKGRWHVPSGHPRLPLAFSILASRPTSKAPVGR